jgi:ABC-type multidrug transport system ATPase subunit
VDEINSEVLGEFEDVIKRFNNTEALSGLSFKIHKGINGLIGPNGAGKTTTIKLSLGLIKANAGRAEMFGFDCWKQSLEIRKRIGILYEKVSFYDQLSGLEHLKLMARLKGVKDPAIESKRVLRLVELDNEAQNRSIGSYSAGMRQRIGLAHALLGSPTLVILDEPTSNLDPLGRARVIEIITDLKKEGFSFLVSSHILSELEKVCEYVVLLNKGRALRQGPMEELLNEATSQSFRIKVHPLAPVLDLLRSEQCVKEVTLDDEYVFAVTNDATLFKQRLPVVVSQANASLEEVKVMGKDLESLFKLAVEGD